jgi:hypothetical protein
MSLPVKEASHNHYSNMEDTLPFFWAQGVAIMTADYLEFIQTDSFNLQGK